MAKLTMVVDIRDFDLDRVGFALSVLDGGNKRPLSEAYLRMTLPELNAFLKALKQARDEIEIVAAESHKIAGVRLAMEREMEIPAFKAPQARQAAE